MNFTTCFLKFMEDLSKNRERNNILKTGSNNLNAENWKVYHPNGHHMFTCGEKRANWYLDRSLAKLTGKNKIQFLFEPRGNGFESNEEFGRSVREVRCVVSGEKDYLQRHHIVPYCYRKYFPEEYKSKNHHDVVLMNHDIHGEYEKIAHEYKDDLARRYGVKTITELNLEYTSRLRELGTWNALLINSIHSLFKSYGKLPREVILDKIKFISEELDLPYERVASYNYIQMYKLYLALKEEHIKEVYEFKRDNRYQFDHGYHLMQRLNTPKKLKEFIILWRQHFIDTMQPQYMPDGWSVNFRVKTKIT